jgi:hypothetical protein
MNDPEFFSVGARAGNTIKFACFAGRCFDARCSERLRILPGKILQIVSYQYAGLRGVSCGQNTAILRAKAKSRSTSLPEDLDLRVRTIALRENRTPAKFAIILRDDDVRPVVGPLFGPNAKLLPIRRRRFGYPIGGRQASPQMSI